MIRLRRTLDERIEDEGAPMTRPLFSRGVCFCGGKLLVPRDGLGGGWCPACQVYRRNPEMAPLEPESMNLSERQKKNIAELWSRQFLGPTPPTRIRFRRTWEELIERWLRDHPRLYDALAFTGTSLIALLTVAVVGLLFALAMLLLLPWEPKP